MYKASVCILLVITLLTSTIGALAEIDYSGMSLDELLATQELLSTAIDEATKLSENQESQAEDELVSDSSQYSELSKGAKGNEVTLLQMRLKELGFYSSTVDGDYGNGTVNALKAFEEFNGLEQTGVATPDLQAYLFSDRAKHKDVSVTSIKVNSNNQTVLVGSTLNIADLVVINPDNATEKGLSFELNSNDHAEISEQGILTAKSRGDVTITITSKERVEKPKSTSLKVKVRQPVTSITLNETEFNVGNGSSHKVEYTIGPEDADNKNVTWTSENPAIATVSKSGSVKGIDTGTTTIICTADDGSGITATATVTVITAVKKVAFEDKSKTLSIDGTAKLTVKVSPENATNPTVKWRSNDSAVATVDASGKVTAKKAGTCIITAEANDGTGASADITIYVEPQLPVMVSSISWQTTWGQKNGKIGVEADNLCVNKTIKSFDCIVACYNYYSSNAAYDFFSYEGSSIKPGKTGKSKLSKQAVSGFSSAYKVEITPIKVYFTDGTEVEIAKDYQYTSTFMM